MNKYKNWNWGIFGTIITLTLMLILCIDKDQLEYMYLNKTMIISILGLTLGLSIAYITRSNDDN